VSLEYRAITLEAFFLRYKNDCFNNSLYELSLSWHKTTHQYMLPANTEVFYHCLFKKDVLQIAWPLVHLSSNTLSTKELHSLTSYYSAISEPILLKDSTQEQMFTLLCQSVSSRYPWSKMTLGPLSYSGEIHQAIQKTFVYKRIYSEKDNWYQDGIIDFQQYYQQRPSQLKNTIKRKQKKLNSEHKITLKIITTREEFSLYFADYQRIYLISWKGNEGRIEFIEQVCYLAIKENKLRMGLLLIDGSVVAAQIWFLEKGTASIFKLAYDPKYKQYSVGSILSMALSEYVIDKDRVTEIEFGMGNEPYKKDWMTKNRQRVTVEVFNNKSINGLLLAVKYLFLVKIKKFFRF